MIKYIIAYVSILIVFLILIIEIADLFGYIKLNYATSFVLFWTVVFPLGYIYHKYKPMTFREVIIKYIKIKPPSWDMIKYKLMILIGIDKNSLNKPKE
jgi:ATP/ADP translocase